MAGVLALSRGQRQSGPVRNRRNSGRGTFEIAYLSIYRYPDLHMYLPIGRGEFEIARPL